MGAPMLHPLCAPLEGLLGTWRGRGVGHYPTIEPFEYVEEAHFSHVGKPFLAYAQRTRDAATDLPLHAESGYLRAVGDERVELVLAQPSGIVEVHAGTIAGGHLELRSVAVVSSPTAKDVTDVHRSVELDGDALTYRVAMAAVGQPLQSHLVADLRRADR